MDRARTMAAALAAAGDPDRVRRVLQHPGTPASTPPPPDPRRRPCPARRPAPMHAGCRRDRHQPIPAAAITAHFDQVFLAKIRPPS